MAGLYFPPSEEHNDCFESFGRLLDSDTFQKSKKVVLLADFNARIGSHNQCDPESSIGYYMSTERESLDKTLNNRGRACIKFMNDFEMIVVNGRTFGDTPGSFTFINSNGKSVVDLTMVNFNFIEKLT